MIKSILLFGASIFACSIIAQPNNVGFNNSSLSNVTINVSYNNSNVNYAVQQAVNVNKPKPQVAVNRPTRRVVNSSSNLTASSSNSNVRRTTRTRRNPVQTQTQTNVASNVTQVQLPPVQAANADENVSDQNINPEPQQQVLVNDINPVQTNKQVKLEENNVNDNQGISINLPSFKKPQIYFSYADLSVTHKSFSLKREVNSKLLKIKRKHKAKHKGRLKKYITNNCFNWR